WQVNPYRLAANFYLCPDPIDSAGALLQRARVPAQVVVDDVAAEAVEVHALRHHAARDEHFREEGTVKGEHQALACLLPRGPVDEPDIRQQPLHSAVLQLVVAKGADRVSPADHARLNTPHGVEVVLPFRDSAARLQKAEKVLEHLPQTQPGGVIRGERRFYGR